MSILRTGLALSVAVSIAGCAQPRNYSYDQYRAAPTLTHVEQEKSLLSGLASDGAEPQGNGSALQVKITNAGGGKGEFESSSAFNARISKVIPPSVSFSARLSGDMYRYDAESGRLIINYLLGNAGSLGYGATGAGSGKVYPSLNLGGDAKILGQFQGQNAFGAKVMVDQVSARQFVLVVGDLDYGSGLGVARIKGSAAIPGDKMKALSTRLAIVVEGELISPFAEKSGEVKEATIQTQQRSILTRYFFRISPSRVSVVDTVSGATYVTDMDVVAARN